MSNNKPSAVELFIKSAKQEFSAFADSIKADDYELASAIISESQGKGGRLHITGIGKPGHVADYIASLFSSTGTPCYFLDGTEAVHGSCGQLVAGDVVIAISNSGETAELMATVSAIKNNKCHIIAVTGNADSRLARESDACLFAGVAYEGGPMNRAPRNSILAEILTLQALSVALQEKRGWTVQDYIRCHPGGALGKIRENEKLEDKYANN